MISKDWLLYRFCLPSLSRSRPNSTLAVTGGKPVTRRLLFSARAIVVKFVKF